MRSAVPVMDENVFERAGACGFRRIDRTDYDLLGALMADRAKQPSGGG